MSAERGWLGPWTCALVGVAVLVLGTGLRIWPGLYAARFEESAIALALCLTAAAACALAWPIRDLGVRLGWTPVVLGIGLAVSGLALWEVPSKPYQVLPRVLELMGGCAALYGMSQLVLGKGVRQRLKPRVGARTRMPAVRRDGRVAATPAHALEVGQKVHLEIDQAIPVDVVLVEGTGFADVSAVHGHAAPVAVEPGRVLLAGTVPRTRGMTAKVKAPHDGSFQAGRVEAFQRMSLELMLADRWDRLGVMVLLAVVVAAGLVPWVMMDAPWDRQLLASASVGLAVVPCLPLVASARARIAGLKVVLLGGLVLQRTRDLGRILAAPRWFVDPMLLSAPGDIEALSLSNVRPEELVILCAGAMALSEGPERQALRAWLENRGHPQPEAHEPKEIERVFYATVEGRRTFAGPLDALEAHAGISVPEDHTASLRFLSDNRMRIVGVATSGDGLLGLVGIRLRARDEVKQASQGLSARLAPGLDADLRRRLADVADLPERGPTPKASDVTLLRESAAKEDEALPLQVLEPYRRARWVEPPGAPPAEPRIVYDGLVRLPASIRAARRALLVGRWRGVSVGVLAGAIAGGLASVGWLEPGFAALLGISALMLAASNLELTEAS
ncbi:MAG: hypothetical protein ACFB9M_09055 [Myxococcota bacterium]